jgi:two-component system, NarL family, nitrate/nitrite response regulator NarL
VNGAHADALRVVVIDDHPMFRAGVVASLAAEPDVVVVAEGDSAGQAIRLATQHEPDICLLDIAMPGGGGLVAARRIRDTLPQTRVVMLTVSEDEDDLLAAMKAGASGYVLKGAAGSELLRVLRMVHAGEVYVAPGLAWGLLREMSRPRSAPLDELSSREREVLELVAEGLSNQEIGDRLGLAEKTIKHYMTSILGKLQVRSRVEAALLAYKEGMARVPDAAEAELER